MNDIELMYSPLQKEILKEKLLTSLAKIIDHGQFIQGPEVLKFEKEAASYTNAMHTISCANGTDALVVALMAIDLKPGDVVFTPSFTYVANVEAISLLGGIPYFIEIDPITYNISIESLITGIKSAHKAGLKLKAILSVDLFGNPAEYNQLSQISEEYGLHFISDAAQSFGAKYKDKQIGNLAEITTTSFFPTKPLGCYGDGGMIFTNDSELADKMKSICFHGRGDDKYNHVRVGMNSRLDSIQAAVLSEKLKIFDQEMLERNQLASFYTKNLQELIKTPVITEGNKSAWAIYNLMHPKRDEIIAKLKKVGIPSNVYYKTPLHMQPAYKDSCLKVENLTVSEEVAQQVFCLPMHGYVTQAQREYIVDNLKKILKEIK